VDSDDDDVMFRSAARPDKAHLDAPLYLISLFLLSFTFVIATMPVPGFLSSIADKAQNALGNTPIAQHIPSSLTGAPRPSASASSPPADGRRNYTLDQIQHQFRQLQQNYS
jgi:hypothetical protein